MLLQCNNISKTFVADPVLSGVSFHVEEGEKVAVVGINGAGKSTIMKAIIVILNGEIPETVAASWLPPTAYICLPNFVLFQINQTMRIAIIAYTTSKID